MANFLFNGVPLPPLPEWDKTTYPYAYMYHGSGGDFFAIAKRRSGPWVDGEGTDVVGFSDVMIYGVSDGAWTFMNSKDSMMHALKETDIFWVNTDLYHTDGTLYLAASEPIPILAPVIDPLSLFLGWKAGNWVARQRGKAKPPVAYLYNGVKLPKLPEWDKTVYPYAVILSSQSTYANLIVSTVPLYYTPVKSVFSTTHRLGAKADGSMLAFVYDSTNDDEVKRTSFVRDPDRDVEGFTAKENVKTLILTSPKWANCDLLYYADDTVCVTASEPVPVYD